MLNSKILFFYVLALTLLQAPRASAILGGTRAEFNDDISRSVVRLVNPQTRRTYCSGVMVSNRVVLTAAHCQKEMGDHMSVVLDPYSSFATAYEIQKFERHEKYAKDSPETPDLALIILKNSIHYAQPIRLLSMDQLNQYDPNQGVEIAGFGVHVVKDSKGTEVISYDNYLRTVVKSNFGRDLAAPQINIVVDQRDKTGVCFGDSGGPAFVNLNGARYVIGINRSVKAPENSSEKHFSNCFSPRGRMTLTAAHTAWIYRVINQYR